MKNSLHKLSDEELLTALEQACRESDHAQGKVIRLLVAIEERRVHLKEAYPSLFEFCRTALRMSEGEAFRRINAARLVKRFPQLLAWLERGDVHLSALVQLRDHLTAENVEDLLTAAKGKNKMQIAELVARIAPRPDVPARLRKLPHYDKTARVTNEAKPSIEPLSEARYRLQLTGSREFRDKLFRLRDMMMHMNPHGDLGVVVERAVDELLEKLEAKLFGKRIRDRRATAGDARLGQPDEADVRPAERDQEASAPRRPGLMRASERDVRRLAAVAQQVRGGRRTFASTSCAGSEALKRASPSSKLRPGPRSG